MLLPNELQELGKHIGSAAVFASNFTLWLESGYFDTTAEFKPLLHLWSLGIEEQFYLLWPMLLLVLWKRPRMVLGSVALLTLASFVLCLIVGSRSSVANFYLPLSRFWELGLGCLLAVFKESRGAEQSVRYGRLLDDCEWRVTDCRRHPDRRLDTAVRSQDCVPWLGCTLPTAGAMCVIAARSTSWFQRRVMASGILVFVGVISYPLYLWHWPTLSFAAILESATPASAVRGVAVY